ncbi:MAG TPA: flagellar biosynthesis protein FlhB [Deltaproteobacteria bacterium]|nr:flagellar biosynthesis protein FlhB [Deltaproteobacteria bacterium]
MKDKSLKAVALRYQRGIDSAPRVTAKGAGILAERILALARDYKVPIQKDTALIEALYRLEINEAIPEELYQVIAEILAFVYRMNRIKTGVNKA